MVLAPLLKQARHVLPRFFAYFRERRVRDLRAVTEAHVVAYARALAETQDDEGDALRRWPRSARYLTPVSGSSASSSASA